jgi:hypothetical protein
MENSNKIVKYALIGGAAVIGAAIAINYLFNSEVEDADEMLDVDLEQLGEL